MTEEISGLLQSKLSSEVLHMEHTYWTLIASALSAAILIAGFWSSKNLSGREKKDRIRRFAVAAFFPLVTIFMFPPYISEYSGTDFLDELEPAEIRSIEDLSKQDAQQARYINRLKKEVERLRADVAEANLFYSRFVSWLVTGFFVFTIIYPLKPKDEGVDHDVPRYPLGLKDEHNE